MEKVMEHFKCYICKKSHWTKQNLSVFNGHLTCYPCIEKAPMPEVVEVAKVEKVVFKVEYYARKSGNKTTVNVDAATEGEAIRFVEETRKPRRVIGVRRATIKVSA